MFLRTPINFFVCVNPNFNSLALEQMQCGQMEREAWHRMGDIISWGCLSDFTIPIIVT